MPYILIVILLVFLSLVIRNVFILIFSLEKYIGSKHKERLNQLKFNKNQLNTTEEKAIDLMNKATNPIVKYLVPSLKIKNITEIEEKLYISKWNKFMTAGQFIALSIIVKVAGFLFFVTQMNKGVVFSLIIGIILTVSIDFLLKNEISERKKKLLLEFPDFIRMMQVYLSGGMTYVDSLTETIQFMGKEWQEIIRNMVIVASKGDIPLSLDILIRDFPIRESKEFASLVKLNISQGGNLSKAFDSQAEKVRELYIDAKEAQIQKRKIYATLVQMPLMVAVMLAFALPMVGSIMEFTGM